MSKRKAVQRRRTRNAAPKSDAGATRRLVRKWFDEVWNKKRAAHIDAVLSPTCIAHGKAADGGDAIVEGRKAAVRWVAWGTHQGPGLLGIPATGKSMRITGMSIIVVKSGRIVEGWDSYDQYGMLQQLGLISPPAASRAL